MRKAFTLMELVVALAILAVVLSFAGVIFRVSIDSHRLALANAEIMQKLRVITEQLDADFRSLRKDGEIFVVWAAEHKRQADYPQIDPTDKRSLAFDRFDRIMFFANGDFQTYGANPERGNVARICYTLARGPSTCVPRAELAADAEASQADSRQDPAHPHPARTGDDQLDTSKFTTADWVDWNSHRQVDQDLAGGMETDPAGREGQHALRDRGLSPLRTGSRKPDQHDRRRRPAGC